MINAALHSVYFDENTYICAHIHTHIHDIKDDQIETLKII